MIVQTWTFRRDRGPGTGSRYRRRYVPYIVKYRAGGWKEPGYDPCCSTQLDRARFGRPLCDAPCVWRVESRPSAGLVATEHYCEDDFPGDLLDLIEDAEYAEEGAS